MPCQSGLWAKLFSIDGSSTNYSKSDFSNVCDGGYGGSYICRFARNTVIATKSNSVNAYVFAFGPSGDGDDVVVAIYIDGVVCSMNRMFATPGWTGISSTSCSRWIAPGTHQIDLVVYGSTGVAAKVSGGMQGGVVSF